MKSFLIVMLLALASVFMVNQAAFDGSLELRQISDSFFVVGIFMFFIGLIGTTGAGSIFRGFSYTFKSVFKRRTVAKSYFEDSQQKVARMSKEVSIAIMVFGIAFIVVALIIT